MIITHAHIVLRAFLAHALRDGHTCLMIHWEVNLLERASSFEIFLLQSDGNEERNENKKQQ